MGDGVFQRGGMGRAGRGGGFRGEKMGFGRGVSWIPTLTRSFVLSVKSRKWGNGESRLRGENERLDVVPVGESWESPGGAGGDSTCWAVGAGGDSSCWAVRAGGNSLCAGGDSTCWAVGAGGDSSCWVVGAGGDSSCWAVGAGGDSSCWVVGLGETPHVGLLGLGETPRVGVRMMRLKPLSRCAVLHGHSLSQAVAIFLQKAVLSVVLDCLASCPWQGLLVTDAKNQKCCRNCQ